MYIILCKFVCAKLRYIAINSYSVHVNDYTVLPKTEKCQIYQETGACCKGCFYLRNSDLIRSISFKCIFARLESTLSEENK